MRYKAKSVAALQLALGGLPDQMRVEIDADVGVSAKTVGELRKVIWPTRSMLVTYTVVCLVFVTFMVIVVTSLDYGFTKLVFALFG